MKKESEPERADDLRPEYDFRKLRVVAQGTARRILDWDLEEQRTAEAYGRQPDSAADAYFDPRVWEP